MKIEYGPPGAKGVTTLMSVGNDGLPAEADGWQLAGVAALAYGLLRGRVRWVAAGAAVLYWKR